jgi:tRNA 5-methylaminomethyl-2-thiouridine biosynthesis bifunctional protein
MENCNGKIEAMILDPDGTPRSLIHDDVYFSAGSGIEESLHNYIVPNKLAERFCIADDFLLVECGFGTGLNFLLTARQWLACAKERTAKCSAAQLHYVSIEKYPLQKDDIDTLFASKGLIFLGQLLSRYPERPAVGETLNFHWPEDDISLTLIFRDIKEALKEIPSGVQAWFLDGFAPAKNPDMWTPDLFHAMSQKSAAGATASSFTSAGIVKQGLRDNGFTVKRRPGYGKKRHIIWAEKK